MDGERRDGDDAFPSFDAATVEELRAYGDERAVVAGEVLLAAGRRPEGFFVVLDGEVEVVQPDEHGGAGPRVGAVGPGQFVGAVSLLTGQRRVVALEHTSEGRRHTVDCAGLFCFIGAEPATDWLDGTVALDDSGFVLTDRALPEGVVEGPAFAARAPLPYETSHPGVFAVGDVRSGSLKRVAAAVGEGSSAVRSVHDHLARS